MTAKFENNYDKNTKYLIEEVRLVNAAAPDSEHVHVSVSRTGE